MGKKPEIITKGIHILTCTSFGPNKRLNCNYDKFLLFHINAVKILDEWEESLIIYEVISIKTLGRGWSKFLNFA